MKIACSSMRVTRYLIVFCYVFTYASHLTSSKLTTTENQPFINFVVQIRNAISILDIIPK